MIDISRFLADEIRQGEEDLEAALDRLLDLIAVTKIQHNISCYTPPSINDELTTILDDRKEAIFEDIADELGLADDRD